jgi:hypothetical protein
MAVFVFLFGRFIPTNGNRRQVDWGSVPKVYVSQWSSDCKRALELLEKDMAAAADDSLQVKNISCCARELTLCFSLSLDCSRRLVFK